MLMAKGNIAADDDFLIPTYNEAGLRTNGPLAKARSDAVLDAARRKLYEQQAFPYRGWYALIAKSGREVNAANGFRDQRVRCYWPNYEKQINASRGRRRCIFTAIIPGLLFSPIADESLFWAVIDNVPYVLNLLRNCSGDLITLENADIEIIRRIEAGENTPLPPTQAFHNFKIGEKVRFIDDINGRWPPGKIIGLSDDGRISIEVPGVMGRAVPFREVLPHQVERM